MDIVAQTANSGEGQQKAEHELVGAEVSKQNDIYDAVVVAAFGGVHVNLPGTDEMLVHPFFVLCFAVCLFVAQYSSIMFLLLDQELAAPVRQWESTSDVLIYSKLLTILILQSSLFSELMGALRLTCFILNPATWTDVDRPGNEDTHAGQRCKTRIFQGLWSCPVVLILSMIAMVMKIFVCYQVIVSSVSIILVTRSVTDSIFNGLAITYIADLDETTWEIVASVCHFDDFEDFEFQVDLDASAKDYTGQPGFCCIGSCFKRQREGSERQPADPERQPEGYGALLERIVSGVLVFFVYLRQLSVIIFALDTNVLPIARDMCTYSRWLNDEGKSVGWWVGPLFKFACKTIFVLDPTEDIQLVTDPAVGGFCTMEYSRMMLSDTWAISWKYPKAMSIGVMVLTLLLVVPEISNILVKRLVTCLESYPCCFQISVAGSKESAPKELTRMEKIQMWEKQLQQVKQNNDKLANALKAKQPGSLGR
mmetsp:Transcript_135576/g.306764  ORF Transcript_135576/g.306764 Transcript_135576/m.306764 type:complete len:480 (+) Transcript_135576:67-1506(+)|eukprot:CAMPEP_0204328516 /NCGR_PEP_ID=MMETSP0469-20131031/13421_1 /ASSEMBLY_ACC=CAM_ASM_000384 /TAXON_ID=2969 /ORGANISM="Oxyrrhis marina" /LENGTH=479 /DNA_ID=CAMNT_0051310921 /DNA_START=1 /DNA_END=1440 /DNA_ORIENTATION=+